MTFKKVSVLIPTRRRIPRLRTLIDSFRATADGDVAEMVFRVDEDDRPTFELLAAEGISHVVGPRHSGYASLPTFFNELTGWATGDVFMCGNDDMVFQSPNWANELLAVANRYPDGIFDLGVTTHNEDHYPFACVSRAVVEKLGFIADPTIFWVDIFLRDVMAFFGRCVMVPQVSIAHDWAGFAPDATFTDSHRDPAAHIPFYWDQVHPRAVASAIEVLKEMHR